MKILSVITHPNVVQPLKLLFIFGTQIKIFLIKSESWITPPAGSLVFIRDRNWLLKTSLK